MGSFLSQPVATIEVANRLRGRAAPRHENHLAGIQSLQPPGQARPQVGPVVQAATHLDDYRVRGRETRPKRRGRSGSVMGFLRRQNSHRVSAPAPGTTPAQVSQSAKPPGPPRRQESFPLTPEPGIPRNPKRRPSAVAQAAVPPGGPGHFEEFLSGTLELAEPIPRRPVRHSFPDRRTSCEPTGPGQPIASPAGRRRYSYPPHPPALFPAQGKRPGW